MMQKDQRTEKGTEPAAERWLRVCLPLQLHFLFCYQRLQLLLLGFPLLCYGLQQVPSTNGLRNIAKEGMV